ncbi:MAG: hypothetical protein DME88_07910 [Verrucomicrobia bacterium]|nr:MAG: hypothetical protein DME88_07910 [Verrucomicrobiota bacterium]
MKTAQSKFCRELLREISPENLDRQLKREQMRIDREFTDRIEQIRRQDHAAWSGFPYRLITLGNELIKEGERLMR